MLASTLAERSRSVTSFDLEDPRDLARLDEPTLALEPLRGLVIIDEIQRRPDLFPVLRVLADRRPRPARFLVLGSASPELPRQGIPWIGLRTQCPFRRVPAHSISLDSRLRVLIPAPVVPRPARPEFRG